MINMINKKVNLYISLMIDPESGNCLIIGLINKSINNPQ